MSRSQSGINITTCDAFIQLLFSLVNRMSKMGECVTYSSGGIMNLGKLVCSEMKARSVGVFVHKN